MQKSLGKFAGGGGDETDLNFDCGGGYADVCIFQNLVSVHLKFVHFILHDYYHQINMDIYVEIFKEEMYRTLQCINRKKRGLMVGKINE